MKDWLRRHMLWVGLAAVGVPLLIILLVLRESLSLMQHKAVTANRLVFQSFLNGIVLDVRSRYLTQAERLLSVSADSLARNQVDEISAHFSQQRWRGAKSLFAVSFDSAQRPRILFYNAVSQRLEAHPDSVEWRAIEAALNANQLMHTGARRFDEDASMNLIVDERDAERRLILRPMIDEASKLTGVAGLILDADFFKDGLLPQAIERAGAQPDFAGYSAELIVKVRDGSQRVVWATQPLEGAEPAVTMPFQFVFTDWRLEVQSRSRANEAWARQVFIVNLTLATVMTLALLGAVWLSLRAAAREMKLSRMKSDFISNMSHELRTPLTSITAFGEFLKHGWIEQPREIREAGEYIESESRRLTALINHILDFSRLESGAREYRFEKAELAEVVESALKPLAAQFEPQGFTIDYQAPSGGRAMIDRDALTQVLINLIDNAVKYSGAARKIEVRLSRRDGFMTLAVSDHGLGIPREEQERIFERFYRVGHGLAHDVKGSGLGLAIVKQIVAAHEGRVTVESEPGAGSTFTIHLPITRD